MALKEERERRGSTQAAFAKLIGARLRTYQKWETTEREPENAGVIWLALRCLKEHGGK